MEKYQPVRVLEQVPQPLGHLKIPDNLEAASDKTCQSEEDLVAKSQSLSRWAIVGCAAAGFLGGAALWVVFWFPPSESSFYPSCAFYDWTGFHCPGCGGFRAWHSLLHGQVMNALRMNVLAVTLFPALTGWLLLKRFFFRNSGDSLFRVSSWGYLWLAMMVVAFGFLRNIPIFPFTWLAP